MTAFQFAPACLAVWEIIEIWRHSTVTATWRARTELWTGWAGRLLHCPFCLAPWVSACVVILLEISTAGTGIAHAGIWAVSALPVYAFAVARAANVGNDLMRGLTRTPKADGLPRADKPEDNIEV